MGDLAESGFEASELYSQFGAYAPSSLKRRPLWLGATLAESLWRTLRSNQYDLRFLQRNLTATLFSWEHWLKKPFVFDVDDAIFLGQRCNSADRISRMAALTICGNNFLADHFSHFGPVAVLPTAVDTNRFVPRGGPLGTRPVIGWSGSSSGLKYLYDIEPAIKNLLNKHPDVLLKVVSDKAPVFKSLPSGQVVFEPWSPDREVAVLHEFTIGIMPLEDDLWARGKCSFKMLTYMAAGLPVVVAPVGMNIEILDQGPCGFSAKTTDDWVGAISSLLCNPGLAAKMGQSGRQIIEARYAQNVIAPRLAQLLKAQL
jgi:glycosyltransferase involved in cell wall biosynthesis